MPEADTFPQRPALSWYERWTLAVYGCLMMAARPLLRRKLARRAQTEPGYAHAVQERFGHYDSPPKQGAELLIWVHAVSLGETRAAAVLVQRLRDHLPGVRLLLTHSTATGWAEGQHLLQPGDVQTWLPWDDPWSVGRFFAYHRPLAGVLMETEIWPNLIHLAGQAGMPMVLANARLNERSAVGAQRLAWLSRPAYAALTVVGAQTSADAQRLQRVGALNPAVWGNLKFDATPDAAQMDKARRWRQVMDRDVVLLASSREGEELDFFKQIKAISVANNKQCAIEKTIFLMVPRHPQRFDAVAQALVNAGVQVVRRVEWGQTLETAVSVGNAPNTAVHGASGPTVWLGDSMGEMALYASLADVALLGGSFQPLGGQNLIELAACGCTVITGPHTFNFADATEQAIEAGVAYRVSDMHAGLELACRMLARSDQKTEEARKRARTWARSHQGAVQQAVNAIAGCLTKSSQGR